MISQLQHEILYLLDRMGPCVSLERLLRRVRSTRHDSRVHRALEEMQSNLWAVCDNYLDWTIANAGRRELELAGKLDLSSIPRRIALPTPDPSGNLTQQVVFHLTESDEPLTRNEIARLCGCDVGSIHAHVGRMKGQGLLDEFPARACRVTRSPAKPVAVAP